MPAEFATTAVEIADDVTPTLATSANQTTANTKLDTLHTDNVALQALVDGVEGSLASIMAKLLAAPSTEAKQDAANTLLTAIAASVDGLEGYTDGLEALATALNGYVDGLEG